MSTRLELHELLQRLSDGVSVYYQPPENLKIQYPAIVYNRSRIENNHANNNVYRQSLQYQVTFIYTDPDSIVPIRLAALPTCRHDRQFVTDNLIHDVFTLYY